MPSNRRSSPSSLRMRFWRNSSLTDRERYPEALSSPRVVARLAGASDEPRWAVFAMRCDSLNAGSAPPARPECYVRPDMGPDYQPKVRGVSMHLPTPVAVGG